MKKKIRRQKVNPACEATGSDNGWLSCKVVTLYKHIGRNMDSDIRDEGRGGKSKGGCISALWNVCTKLSGVTSKVVVSPSS